MTREQRQARAAALLAGEAERRTRAQAEVAAATEQVRVAVLAARAAGITVRRTAELGGVSVDTVNRWTAEAAEQRARERLLSVQMAADPARRGHALALRVTETRVRAGQREVRLFTARPGEVAAVLRAAYKSGPTLWPTEQERQAAVAAAVEAGDPHPVDVAFGYLDLFARLLLHEPAEAWRQTLAPHLPPWGRGAALRGAEGARQVLDTVLAAAFGALAPGTVVLAAGELAIVTETHWRDTTVDAYVVMPADVRREARTVPADQVTAAD
ncbi:hypothetical protein [Planomonospora sp. ID82291]|uniref:hypothetical protein n=1 Tax=Planomonospora sp. ID82291 TaxID=2738136 RepID=UPI0018C3E059|nr:hypothetical protein [Planomonospora sp. ID82291]MBG0819073.1 hypothetical protein [Planomonospora sp. ID82291]